MTESEYNAKMAKIQKEYKEAENALNIEYVKGQYTYKKGDIIYNGVYVLVDRFGVFAKRGSLPCPVYVGFQLTQKLTLRKDKKRLRIYDNKNTRLIKVSENNKNEASKHNNKGRI